MSRVVTSPKPYMDAHTFCRAPNQTQLGTPIHTTKPSTQATKHNSYDPVCYTHLQPNGPRCMVSSGMVRACTGPPSRLADQGAMCPSSSCLLIHTSPDPTAQQTPRPGHRWSRKPHGVRTRTRGEAGKRTRQPSRTRRAATSASAHSITAWNGTQLAQAGGHSGDCLFRRQSYPELFAVRLVRRGVPWSPRKQPRYPWSPPARTRPAGPASRNSCACRIQKLAL